MAHRMWRGVVTVALVAFVGACGPFCKEPSALADSKLHLVFTGPAPGTLTSGDIDCRLFNKDQFNALVTGRMNGNDVIFNIQVLTGFHGPDTYKVGTTLDGAANLRLQVGDWVGSSPPNAGQLIMHTDNRSGVVDANLGDFEHVTGSFTCAEVKS